MASEEFGIGLNAIRDEVLRKIGRNLLLFQDIERQLKFLVAINGFTVTPSSDANAFDQHKAPFEQQTLGQIKSHFVDRVLLRSQVDPPAEELQEFQVRSSLALEMDRADLEQYTRVLDALIAERNQLVHHFLPRCDLNSAQSLTAAAVSLDEQRERALDVHRWLESVVDAFQDTCRETQRFLDSPEGRAELDLWLLQSSTLVARLHEVATERQRPDGWTVLALAGSLLREEVTANLPTLKARFGVRSLKELLVASDVFDVVEEPTGGGATRTVYRAKLDDAD
jgi:hypothetical protein